jgi:cell wall-associated NlpC family hydrolase
MNNVQSKPGILQVPSPKTVSTIFMKRLSEYCLLIVFLGLIMTGCGPQPRFTSATPEERRSPNKAEEQSARKDKSKIDKAKMGRIIESFLGVPYQYGGDTKSGMDCSGLVRQVYRQYAGFNLPGSTKKLYQLVKKVDQDDLAYGDLVFFSDGWFSVSHVGIYVGQGQFVHSAKSSGVIVSSLDENYYKRRYRGARRVIP